MSDSGGVVGGLAILALVGMAAFVLPPILGNKQADVEVIGQAKRLSHMTNLVCDNYPAFDISLGVMQNGTGSMSTGDQWFTVASPDVGTLDTLKKAVEGGKIVKVTYDLRRWAPCSTDHWLRSVSIVN